MGMRMAAGVCAVGLAVALGGCSVPPPGSAPGLARFPVSVTSKPSGAATTVDSAALGTTTTTVQLTRGPHTLRLSLGGCMPLIAQFRVEVERDHIHAARVAAH